jgi:hypothetical protein
VDNLKKYDSQNSEDKKKILELKKSLFEKYQIDERILDNSFIEE